MHLSICRASSPPVVERCRTCCKLFHCPLCTAAMFKPAKLCRVNSHIRIHIKKAVVFRGLLICRCNLECRKVGHYHCPLCPNVYLKRDRFLHHIHGCRRDPSPSPASHIMNPAAVRKTTGLVAATFTPFTASGEINLSVIKHYVNYLVYNQGVKSIFVNGTTGEGMSLSVEERKDLADEWCRHRKELEQVIVHVGCMSLKDSQELARHAVEAGADGIAVISPSFLKPSSVESLQLYLKEVAKVAPSLPFYYYHLPAVTGVNLPARDVIKGIEKLIPSFKGVKFSGTDLMDLGLCLCYCPDHWSVLYGVDEQLLGGLAMGACGAVGSTYNYMGNINNLLLSAFEVGDLLTARKIEFKVQDFMSHLFKLGFGLPMNKLLMSEISRLDLGPPRLPLQPCDPSILTTCALALRQLQDTLDSQSGQGS